MSTKIFNGYRRRTTSLADLSAFLDRWREASNAAYEDAVHRAVARRCAEIIDRARLSDEPRPDYVLITAMNEVQEAYTKTRLPGGTARLMAVGGQELEVHLEPRRDPRADFACDLVVFPKGRWTYFMLFAEQEGYETPWRAMPGVEAYSYWNNTDRPAEVSEREWTRRARVWAGLLGHDAPARRGLLLETAGDILPCTSIEDVLARLPPREERIAHLAKLKAHAPARALTTTGDVIEWLQSDAYRAAQAEAAEAISPSFEDAITATDLAPKAK